MNKFLSALAAGCLQLTAFAHDGVTVTHTRSADTLLIRYKDTSHCIYEDGKLKDWYGSEFKNAGAFADSIVWVLCSARFSKKAAEIIDTLQKSKVRFVIVDWKECRFVPFVDTIAQAKVMKKDTTGPGSGGWIYIKLNSRVEVFPRGIKVSYVANLMHEMIHAFYANSHDRNTSDGEEGLYIDEWNACEDENIIRAELKLPFRKHYYTITGERVQVVDRKGNIKNPYRHKKPVNTPLPPI